MTKMKSKRRADGKVRFFMSKDAAQAVEQRLSISDEEANEIAQVAHLDEIHWPKFREALRRAWDTVYPTLFAKSGAYSDREGTPGPVHGDNFRAIGEVFKRARDQWGNQNPETSKFVLFLLGMTGPSGEADGIAATLDAWIAQCDALEAAYSGAQGIDGDDYSYLRAIGVVLGEFWEAQQLGDWNPRFGYPKKNGPDHRIAKNEAGRLLHVVAIFCVSRIGLSQKWSPSADDCYTSWTEFFKPSKGNGPWREWLGTKAKNLI